MRSFFEKICKEECRIAISAVSFLTALVLSFFKFEIVSFVLAAFTVLVSGITVFIGAVKGIIRRDLLDEKFLMSLASVGAFAVGEATEGAAVMLFFLIGEYFEKRAVQSSRKSIKALMDFCPDEATLYQNGEETTVDAEDVEKGSIILIRTGERVPIDSVITEGMAYVDTSAVTGEALPRACGVGDEILSGSIITSGLIKAETLRLAEESSASRILALVENANERKSKTENFITKFSHYYTPIVVISAILLATLLPIFKLVLWEEAVYRALMFLVISCPCALVISVPMAFFGGIGSAASKGILFKGGNTFSALSTAKSFVFDKTGTLTKGELEIDTIECAGACEEEILYFAASAEYGSNHPIAKAIKAKAMKSEEPISAREMSGMGISAVIGKDEILVGNSALMSHEGVLLPVNKDKMGAVFVAKNREYIGALTFSDKLKEESCEAVAEIKRLGCQKTMILSGDFKESVEKVSRSVGIDEAYSELLPKDKYEKLEQTIGKGGGVVFVGDGINDAPAIARADVGIAMGGIGQDSAIEAADVVITSDNLMKLPEAVRIARKTVAIAKENIVFALGVKLLMLALGALGIANMWFAVFADVGVSVLAILNSMRTLK